MGDVSSRRVTDVVQPPGRQSIAVPRPAIVPGLAIGFLLCAFGVPQMRAQLPPNLRGRFERLGYEQIELRRTGENHLYVTGKLDGRCRSVLVDTGWSLTTISTNTAGKLHNPPHNGGTNHSSSTVTIGELKLGRIAFANEPALVEHVVFNRQPAAFDLVLGCDFLRRHFAVIACANRRLYVRNAAPHENSPQTWAVSLRASGFQEVPLHLKRPSALTCLARVNGQPVELLVDTGAAWSCLDERQCARLGLNPLPSVVRITGAGATGTRQVAVAKVNLFQLGGVELGSPTLALLDLADWGLAAPGKTFCEVQGVLGGEILAQTGALIDCDQLMLWVRRPMGKR
jgi:predicted aspartyl protease